MFLVNTFQNAHSALSPLANESPSLVVGRPATMGAVASDGMFWKQLLQLIRLEDGIWAVGSSQQTGFASFFSMHLLGSSSSGHLPLYRMTGSSCHPAPSSRNSLS